MEFPEGGRGIVCGPFLENPEGWGGHIKNPFRGGGMDIFWNHTLQELSNLPKERKMTFTQEKPQGHWTRRFSLFARGAKYSTVTQDMSPSGVNF